MWVEQNGPVWRVRDERGGKKITIKSGYANKTAARIAKIQFEADAIRGDELKPGGGELLLNDWLDVWLPAWETGLKPSTHHSETGRIRNHIRPLLGLVQLGHIDKLVVQQWVAKLQRGERAPADPAHPKKIKWKRKPLAPKTVRNCHALLYKVMHAAAAQKLVRTNPCLETTLPARVHYEMRCLTEPEIARLIAAMPPHWRPLVLLLVSTGLRWGEATGLRVGRVDALTKPAKLTVVEQMQELSGTGEIIFVPPKTEKGRRTVTFTMQVAEGLAGLLVDKGHNALIFNAPMGGPVRTRNFRRTWLKSVKAAGLDGLRIHDLRHTHAGALLSANVPLTAIQRRLGHSSIAVTSDLYGHLLPQVDEGILAAVALSLSHLPADALEAEVQAELAGVE